MQCKTWTLFTKYNVHLHLNSIWCKYVFRFDIRSRCLVSIKVSDIPSWSALQGGSKLHHRIVIIKWNIIVRVIIDNLLKLHFGKIHIYIFVEHCCHYKFPSIAASIRPNPRSIQASIHPWPISAHHSDQMFQRSQVSMDILWRSRDTDRMEIGKCDGPPYIWHG